MVQEQFASRVGGRAACSAGGSQATPKNKPNRADGTRVVCVTRGGRAACMAGGSTATPKNKTGSRWYKNSLRHAWGVGPPVRPAAARQPPKTSQQTADGSRRVQEQFASRVGGRAACSAGGSKATPKNKSTDSRWYNSSLHYAWGVGPPVRPAAARQPPKTRQQIAGGTRAGFGQKQPFPNDPRREIQ